jgi:hypothetical protein
MRDITNVGDRDGDDRGQLEDDHRDRLNLTLARRVKVRGTRSELDKHELCDNDCDKDRNAPTGTDAG